MYAQTWLVGHCPLSNLPATVWCICCSADSFKDYGPYSLKACALLCFSTAFMHLPFCVPPKLWKLSFPWIIKHYFWLWASSRGLKVVWKEYHFPWNSDTSLLSHHNFLKHQKTTLPWIFLRDNGGISLHATGWNASPIPVSVQMDSQPIIGPQPLLLKECEI